MIENIFLLENNVSLHHQIMETRTGDFNRHVTKKIETWRLKSPVQSKHTSRFTFFGYF